jgi:pimeloyl-ACP methyl ester carboxylesterase
MTRSARMNTLFEQLARVGKACTSPKRLELVDLLQGERSGESLDGGWAGLGWTMPKANVNGVDLYYEVYGEGPSILGIHGTPSSALLWVDAAKELGNRGSCTIYDRRGFFRSQRPEPFETVDLSDHVNDAAALLDALAATPAVVIGRSTGGQIALELARRCPDRVKALVLLEPAVFTVDPKAAAWADRLRRGVLQAAVENPSAASEAVFREALGDRAWDAFPAELKGLFAAASPTVLAEMRGQGLDLSEQPLHLSAEELAGIRQPTLLVSAEDSPDVLWRVNDRLADALPHAEIVHVAGGHLIDPAHPTILGFVDRILTSGHVVKSSER